MNTDGMGGVGAASVLTFVVEWVKRSPPYVLWLFEGNPAWARGLNDYDRICNASAHATAPSRRGWH